MAAIRKQTNEKISCIGGIKMASKYFRITGYCPQDDYCFILDSNGMFEERWQFSSLLVRKGLKILEISTDEQFGDINIVKASTNLSNMVLRAATKGKPLYTESLINGKKEKVVNVGEKSYIPNKSI